jgi:hypothetical protein
MRETFTSGSVGRAPGNRCLYPEGLTVLTDYLGRKVRLTAERRQHILQHPEMVEWVDKIGKVLAHPE